MKRLIVVVTILFLVALLSTHCAKVVSPSGGAKDTIPPRLIRSVPQHGATNFSGKKVSLSFDEYVQLKDINQKLILSPPQKNLPEARMKGKNIDVIFAEELMDSTTYTLYFSDAIVDNNEGNKLNNFEFAFSTGSYIDSLMLEGVVIDAFTLEPADGILVMLYKNFADTVPITQHPMYVTKTNKEGLFKLSNLRNSDYKIFALKDLNANYLFDQVSESVAFKSELIGREQLKSFAIDDSIVDSLHLTHHPIELKLFTEDSRVLKLTDFSRPLRRKLNLGFSSPIQGLINLTPLEAPTIEPWYISEISPKGDSVSFWITSDEVAKKDSLIAIVEYQTTDSLLNLVPSIDTIRLFYNAGDTIVKKGKLLDKKKFALKIGSSKGNKIKPSQAIALNFEIPLVELNPLQVSLMQIKDSLSLEGFSITKDTLSTRSYSLNYKWEIGKQYQITFLPGAFKNLDGKQNDSIVYKVDVQAPEDFGVVNLTLTGVLSNVVVELITEKGKTVESYVLNKNGIANFTYVNPENYSFRFIIDENANGKWDTGYYIEGTQPEKVIYFNEAGKRKAVNVRKNWEYDFTFDLEPYLNN